MRARRPPSLFAHALGLAFGLCASLAQTYAQTAAAAPEAKLVVGTMRAPPFALRSDDGEWSGLSIELWRKVAGEL
jgi:polar amino acid transport system substrate-binding protein